MEAEQIAVSDEGAWECPICKGETAKEAHAIMVRVGSDTSFANLWKRLDAAERDRDRMLNALQFAIDAARRNDGALKPREFNVLYRAIRRVSQVHAIESKPHDH